MNGIAKYAGLAGLLLAVAGCGGGGGSGRSSTGPITPPLPLPPPPPPSASVNVIVAQADIQQTLDWPSGSNATMSGTWNGSNLGSESVYLEISDSLHRIAGTVIQAPTGGQWSFELVPMEDVPNGVTMGQLTVRACKDLKCATTWPNASVVRPYKIDTVRQAGWLTAQKGAAHDGYVPIMLDPAKFSERWTWKYEGTIEAGARIHSVVGANGRVVVGTNGNLTQDYLFVLDEQTGGLVWKIPFGTRFAANNPPAVANGKVYVQTTGQTDTNLWAFHMADGAVAFKSPFDSQWGHTLAPTPYGDGVYINGGFNGGSVYAFDALSGARRWAATVPYRELTTPAVDANGVYFDSGNGVEIWNLADGSSLGTIIDVFGDGLSSLNNGYRVAPIISDGKLFAYSAGTPWGGLGASIELPPPYYQRVISGFDLAARVRLWTSQELYATQAAAANGLVFAARSMPASLDALDAATGRIAWSWKPTQAQGDSFFRNIVVTRNMVFASTDKAVFAIDLATHSVVWSYPKPGAVSIIADRTLLITVGGLETDGNVVAIGLK